MRVNAEHLLQYVIKILYYSGGWAENGRQKIVFLILILQGIVLMFVTQALTIKYAPNVDVAIQRIAYPFQYITVFIKVIWFYTHRSAIIQLILECGDIRIDIGLDKEEEIMKKDSTPFIKLFHRYTTYTLTMIPISYIIGTIDHGFGSKAGSGFDINDEGVYLWMASFYFTTATCYGCLIGICMDLLPAGVYCCITMRIKILQTYFKDLGIKSKMSELDVSKQLIDGTMEFIRIQQLVQKAEKAFNGMILAQTMLCGITISIALNRMSKASIWIDPSRFVNDASFAATMVFVLWIAMSFANDIQYESERLLQHIAASDWINIALKNKKQLIMVQEGMKRQLCVRCFGRLKLNLRVFTTIVQTSYKVYTLMRDVGH